MPTLDTDLARQVSEREPALVRSAGAGDQPQRDPGLDRLARLEYVANLTDPMTSGPIADETDDLGGFDFGRLREVNKDLWIILSLLVIAAVANHLLAAQRLVLGFYTLPTIFAAFYRGRRHATLTAAASALLVGFISYFNPNFWSGQPMGFYNARLYDMATWGLMLMLTAYTMGTLHERFAARSMELRRTYHGLLMILRQFVNQDEDAANHSYRVSEYATALAEEMDLDDERVELVRAAALLHDLGKGGASREVLLKAAELNVGDDGAAGGTAASMGRVLPIILAQDSCYDDGTPDQREMPLEARIIAVADVFDALRSNGPSGGAAAEDARDTIRRGAGTEFDPQVVRAFLVAYDEEMMGVPRAYA